MPIAIPVWALAIRRIGIIRRNVQINPLGDVFADRKILVWENTRIQDGD